MQLLQYTTSLLGGSGHCNFCIALPHRLGAMGGGSSATHRLAAWGREAVQLLRYIASLLGRSGLLPKHGHTSLG